MAELLLEAKNISLTYGVRQVLHIDKLQLYDGDRVGLVGENGAGKTTLLKVLSQSVRPDTGFVRALGSVSVIAQTGDTNDEIDRALKSRFAASDSSDTLSGGERTRRRIAGALSREGQILFADEPTVDLDEAGVRTLEETLIAFNGALIVVSHDRQLLNNVCTSIWELEDGRVTVFSGNYAKYREIRRQRLERETFAYEQTRAEEKRLKKLIQQEFEHAQQKQRLPSRMGNSEARLHKREATNVQAAIHRVRRQFESRLDRLDEIKRPREDVSIRMSLGESDAIVSKICVRGAGISARFGAKTLYEASSFVIPVHSRTALLGENGAGKTTLIKKILSRDKGIAISPGVEIGYFGQLHAEVLDEERTIIENARAGSEKDEATVRTVLANLNIRGDDVYKKVSVLSGGEKTKVQLARLLVSRANLLILDEPTNHLDVFSLEALEALFRSYMGTLLLVSHDRHFVREVATRLILIENKRLVSFEGGVDEWEEARKKQAESKKAQENALLLTSLEMRLAAAASRLSKPQKGDDPEALNRAYNEIAEKIRALHGK